jgi:DNA polymerase-3 subunit epsilon
LLAALGGLRLREWPYAGATIFAERDEAHGRSAFHVFDHWCHLGSFDTHEAALKCAETPARRFDAEKYRLLQRWLAQPGHSVTAGVAAA